MNSKIKVDDIDKEAFIELISSVLTQIDAVPFIPVDLSDYSAAPIAIALASHCSNLAESALACIKASNEIPAMVLARTVFETAVIAQYICQIPDATSAFLKSSSGRYKKYLDKSAKIMELPSDLQIWLEENASWENQKGMPDFTSICKLFKEADTLVFLYSSLSSPVHVGNFVIGTYLPDYPPTIPNRRPLLGEIRSVLHALLFSLLLCASVVDSFSEVSTLTRKISEICGKYEFQAALNLA